MQTDIQDLIAASNVSVDHALKLIGAHSELFATHAAEGFKSWPAELREAGALTAQALKLPCGKVEVATPPSLTHIPTSELNSKAHNIESRLDGWAAAAKPSSMEQALTVAPVTYQGIATMITEASGIFDALRKKPLTELEDHDVSATIESCGAAVEKLTGLYPAESTEHSVCALRLLCKRVDSHVTRAKLTVNMRIAARDNDKTIEECVYATAENLATQSGNPAMKQPYFDYFMQRVAD